MIKLFKVGKTIIKTLKDNGFEAYFVGGCVRDYYMNRQIHDVDITTDAMPDEVENLFTKTIDVGKEHGTVIVLADSIPFEVTTFRTDGGDTDYHHPDQVIFSSRLNDDLQRRDFTMNAMAMSEDMTFHDPFSGRAAIQKQKIDTVGLPSERFEEDALRIIRAIRFMSVLNFAIEASTEKSMILNAGTIEHVSIERIVSELKKMYHGPGLKKAKEKLAQTGLKQYIPFFKYVDPLSYVNGHADDFIDELIIQTIRDESLNEEIKYLKLSNAEKSLVKNGQLLFEAANNDEIPKKIAYQYHKDIIERMIRLNSKNDLMKNITVLNKALDLQPALVIRSRKELEVNGRHLMELYNAESGPWIKECLNIIENEVLFERVNNNHNDIINWVKRHVEVRAESIKVTK